MPVEVEKVGQRASSFVPALPLDYNWCKRQHQCAHRRAGGDIDCGVNGVVDRAAATLQSAPVMFIENVNQFDECARFQ